MNIELNFADRVQGLEGSAIREIFKVIQEPDIISFAGGLPAAEMFPNKELAEISKEILDKEGEIALQYGITEGYQPLIDLLKNRMKEFNIGAELDNLIIVSGAQQGIDLTAKVFLNEGDGIIAENPSFIGALNSFRAYKAKVYPADLDEDGINIEQVEETLKTNKNIKLIYTIPTFQNPSGITMSLEKRKKLLELANKYNIYIIEDNPYGELRFKGQDLPTIKSLDKNGRVIYVGSFSKILSPGLRLGWTVANSEIIKKIVIVKQVNDVHTNVLAQMMAVEYMKRYSIDEHIKKIQQLYGNRCSFMLECINKYFPAYCKPTKPEGGLFLLCTLPEGYNSAEILKKSIENKVAFVPGSTFMVDQGGIYGNFRLNYSTVGESKIEQGIKTLGKVIENI